MVREALNQASARENRISLINLLSGCADADALVLAKAALTDPDLEVRTAAVSVLGDWPDPSAWEALLQIYGSPETESSRGIALRGLVRLAGEGNAQAGGQVLQRYMQLLSGAKADADLKLILGALGGVARPEALQLVLPLLTNSAVRAEAEVAVRKIAESIKAQHPEAAKDALARLEQH
jgi:HEAT repeat protein